MRTSWIIALTIAGAACRHASDDTGDGNPASTVELTAHDVEGQWPGLLKPSAIHVAPDGRVFVADNGDRRIRIFDRRGLPLGEMGRSGAGPGEFERIQDFAILDTTLLVLDGGRRAFVRLSLSGTFVSERTRGGGAEEMMSALGDQQLVLASSARWAGPVTAGRTAWPLARVVDLEGDSLFEIGRRELSGNPFAAHIENFVLPAGTPDGGHVWLAFLNDPRVLLYSVRDDRLRTVTRTLPFEWETIPDTFSPADLRPAPGSPPAPPFDVVTYGIASDGSGRAYVLTALSSSRNAGNEPERMAIDVVAADGSGYQRLTFPGTATHIAISPDGAWIFVLDDRRAVIRTFANPIVDVE